MTSGNTCALDNLLMLGLSVIKHISKLPDQTNIRPINKDNANHDSKLFADCLQQIQGKNVNEMCSARAKLLFLGNLFKDGSLTLSLPLARKPVGKNQFEVRI